MQALQARNRLLQSDLDTLKAKYAGEQGSRTQMKAMHVWCSTSCLGHMLPSHAQPRLTHCHRTCPNLPSLFIDPFRPSADLHRSSEAQVRSLQGTQQDLVAAKDQVAALQAAQAELHEERGRLQAELASARQQAAIAQQAQQEAEQQRAAVQERLALAESALGDSRQLAAKSQDQHAEAAAAAAEMRQQLAEAQQAAAEAQQRLAAVAGEKQEWSQQRSELQEQVAALQKAQAVADGKLVVARQREAQFKVRLSCG